jgi:hypothetical protein
MLQTNWTWYNDWQDILLPSSIIHAKTSIIFKVMKVIGIFHHDCFPTIFEMNCVEVWQSSQTCRLFIIRRGVLGAMLMSPNAIANFLLWWYKWNTFFSSSTSYKTKLVQGTNLTSYMNLANLCSFAWILIIWGWSTIDICGE